MNSHTRNLIRRITMIVMLGFFVVGSLFAGGYAMEDPGGAAGLLLIAEWVVPAVIVAVLAWRKSPFALALLALATAAVVMVALLEARDPMAWQQVWDQRGPVLAVSGFGLSMALAVYGRYQRTRLAGALLVASCGVSLFAGAIMGTQEGPVVGGSTSAGVLPGLIAGVVYLLVGDN
jgi:hypothetical protein